MSDRKVSAVLLPPSSCIVLFTGCKSVYSTICLRLPTFFGGRVGRLPSTDDQHRALTGRGGLGSLHLPGGPVGPPARWAATSDVELGQTTCPFNRGMVEMEGRERRDGQSHKRKRGKERVEWGRSQGSLAREGRLNLDICASPPPQFLVTPLLIGPVCLLSQGLSAPGATTSRLETQAWSTSKHVANSDN